MRLTWFDLHPTAMRLLLPHASSEDLPAEEALGATIAALDPYAGIWELIDLIPLLSEPLRGHAIDHAQRFIEKSNNLELKARVLIKLGSHIPHEIVEEAIRHALGAQDQDVLSPFEVNVYNLDTFVELVSHLSDEWREKEMPRHIDQVLMMEPSRRDFRLVRLAPLLPIELLSKVVAETLRLQDTKAVLEALLLLAPFVAPGRRANLDPAVKSLRWVFRSNITSTISLGRSDHEPAQFWPKRGFLRRDQPSPCRRIDPDRMGAFPILDRSDPGSPSRVTEGPGHLTGPPLDW